MIAKLLLCLPLCFVSVPAFAKGVPLQDGRYRLIAEIVRCEPAPTHLCAVLDKGSRSEKTVTLEPSKWDESLASVMGLKIVLVGTLKSLRLTLQAAPKMHRETVEELAEPQLQIRSIK